MRDRYRWLSLSFCLGSSLLRMQEAVSVAFLHALEQLLPAKRLVRTLLHAVACQHQYLLPLTFRYFQADQLLV